MSEPTLKEVLAAIPEFRPAGPVQTPIPAVIFCTCAASNGPNPHGMITSRSAPDGDYFASVRPFGKADPITRIDIITIDGKTLGKANCAPMLINPGRYRVSLSWQGNDRAVDLRDIVEVGHG